MTAPVRLVTLMFFRAPAPVIPVQARIPASFLLITEEDRFPWSVVGEASNLAAYRNRFARGHAALVGDCEGVAAFRAWIASSVLDVDELRYRWMLPDADRCMYDVITAPEFRGQGLYPAALTWYAEQRERTALGGRVWIYCESSNAASRKGITKAGFMPAGRIRALWVLGRMIIRCDRLPQDMP